MKKFIQVLSVAVLLAGCSSLPSFPALLATQTSPPDTETPTPFISETPIPTQNLFATATPTPMTFTPTPTALGAELFTPTSTPTSLPTDFPTPDIPLDPQDSALGRYALYVMDRDGSNRRRVFPPAGDPGLKPQRVAWSPSGDEIALVYLDDIYLVDVASGTARQLTSDGQSSNPQWVR